MLEAFIEQDYLIIQNNVVTNNITWDGDTTVWTPPLGSIALLKNNTPARIWVDVKQEVTPPTVPPRYNIVYELQEVIGVGDIGFTWDGSVLTTNEPDPQLENKLHIASPSQPSTTGTVTIE